MATAATGTGGGGGGGGRGRAETTPAITVSELIAHGTMRALGRGYRVSQQRTTCRRIGLCNTRAYALELLLWPQRGAFLPIPKYVKAVPFTSKDLAVDILTDRIIPNPPTRIVQNESLSATQYRAHLEFKLRNRCARRRRHRVVETLRSCTCSAVMRLRAPSRPANPERRHAMCKAARLCFNFPATLHAKRRVEFVSV